MISTTLPKEARDLLINASKRKDLDPLRKSIEVEKAIERVKHLYPQYFKKDEL